MCATSAIRALTAASSRSRAAARVPRVVLELECAACVIRVRAPRNAAASTRSATRQAPIRPRHQRGDNLLLTRIGADALATRRILVRPFLCLLLYNARKSDFINFLFVKLGVLRYV